MKHYDQNMIELYVLGSEKVKGVRDELEQHLKECYTCRSLARNWLSFIKWWMGASRCLMSTRKQATKMRWQFGQCMAGVILSPSGACAAITARKGMGLCREASPRQLGRRLSGCCSRSFWIERFDGKAGSRNIIGCCE